MGMTKYVNVLPKAPVKHFTILPDEQVTDIS